MDFRRTRFWILALILAPTAGCKGGLEAWCKGDLAEAEARLGQAQLQIATRTGAQRNLAGAGAGEAPSPGLLDASELRDQAYSHLSAFQGWNDQLREHQRTRGASDEVLRAANQMVRLEGALALEDWSQAGSAIQDSLQALARARAKACQ